MAKLERATQRRGAQPSKVTLGGNPIEIANFDPLVFARSITKRKGPKTHADRVRILEAAEVKLGLR